MVAPLTAPSLAIELAVDVQVVPISIPIRRISTGARQPAADAALTRPRPAAPPRLAAPLMARGHAPAGARTGQAAPLLATFPLCLPALREVDDLCSPSAGGAGSVGLSLGRALEGPESPVQRYSISAHYRSEPAWESWPDWPGMSCSYQSRTSCAPQDRAQCIRTPNRGAMQAVPTGFEPAISSLTGTHVRPLHHGTNAGPRIVHGAPLNSPLQSGSSARASARASASWRCATVRSPRVFSRMPRAESVERRKPPVSASG